VAATAAVSSPLLEDASVQGARGVIINVTGGPDLTLAEVSDASEIVHSAAHEDANIIFGAVVDPTMEGQIKITVIATGFDHVAAAVAPGAQAAKPTPVDLSVYTAAQEQPAAPAERPVAVASSRVVVARRPVLDMAAIGRRPAMATVAADGDDSPLDVPAFLRQREG
jgi:cell division protein FtsZ